MGSSATKIAAYDEEGRLLAEVRLETSPRHASQGAWELEPEIVWRSVVRGVRQLVATAPVRKNPPRALGISASGREAFPVDAEGIALGPCIMAGDTRESGREESTAREFSPKRWFSMCGHLPERMDPIFRLFWWRTKRPNVMAKARYFLGWHEFFALRLAGRPVTDPSLASKWLAYDLRRTRWSPERLSQLGVEEDLLPEIQPWGTAVGPLKREIASKLDLSSRVILGVGAFDASCSALGAGVSRAGTGCLLSGTWEDVIVPISFPPGDLNLAGTGFSVSPHPGRSGAAVFALSPNGTSVVNWARRILNISQDLVERKLLESGPRPSPVLAIPHLSGATVPWTGGGSSHGALFGLSLATSKLEILKAMMESIVYDLARTLDVLEARGLKPDVLNGAGGGVRSEWWTQLKADLTGIPVDLVNQPEPGTLGAAFLGGLAEGAIVDIDKKISAVTKVERRIESEVKRARLYEERIRAYNTIVADILESI